MKPTEEPPAFRESKTNCDYALTVFRLMQNICWGLVSISELLRFREESDFGLFLRLIYVLLFLIEEGILSQAIDLSGRFMNLDTLHFELWLHQFAAVVPLMGDVRVGGCDLGDFLCSPLLSQRYDLGF